jgi:hypothetical protein
MRDQIQPAPAAAIPLAAQKATAPGTADGRASLRALCKDVLALGRAADVAPWKIGHVGNVGVRLDDGDGLPVAYVENLRETSSNAKLITKYRSAAPVLAAELLRRLDAEEAADGR